MKFKIFVACLAIVFAFTGLQPGLVQAGVDDFVITNFTADYYLSRDDPQGTMRVVESIEVNFSDFNHGLLRAIPLKYKNRNLKLRVTKVSSPSGAPSSFTTYNQNDNMVVKIGDPNQTVTGMQSYAIEYELKNVVTFYKGHDELYWDINGDQWRQPFERVTARFHLPAGQTSSKQECFTGGYGTALKNCTITGQDKSISVATTRRLQPYENLSVVIALQKSYFVAPTAYDWIRDNFLSLLAVALPPLFFGGWAFKRWHRHGKDLKGKGVIVAEYGPPSELTPAEAGVIANYRLDPREVSATIVDLAIRKYLRIIETTEKKILKDKKAYQFELLNPNLEILKPHEKRILEDIFASRVKGEKVTLDSLKNKFYKTIQSLQKSLPSELTKKGYFAMNPRTAGASLYITGFILFFVAWLFGNWLSVGLIVAALLTFTFAALMTKRSADGVAANDAIKGLKMYMETAEKDRINMLQSPDSPYAHQGPEPTKTVELFEKLLPFAIVLGVENDWAKQFEGIYNTPPDWYSGNWSNFNAMYLASSLNNSVSAMGTNFSAPSSSGGSGFSSGGGFSGGGGGGGGGGGW